MSRVSSFACRAAACAALLTLAACGGGAGGSGGGGGGPPAPPGPSTDATLAALAPDHGALAPGFVPATLAYALQVGFADPSIAITPTVNDANASIRVEGLPVPSGSPSVPIPLAVGPNALDVVVTAEDGTTTSAYVVTVTRDAPLAHRAYVKASNTGSGDRFGTSVAIWGDRMVVGAPMERGSGTGPNAPSDELANEAGAAYVYRFTGGAWTFEAVLKASNTAAFDRFGTSVAISGDTIAVGARFEDGGSAGVNGNEADDSVGTSGAVYVFVRAGGNWTQQAYVKASNPGIDDEFGACLSLDGDVLVVGAPFEDSDANGVNGNQADESAPGAGAAYLFTRTGSTWTQTAYLKAADSDGDDNFGVSVGVSGNLVVVGAPFEDGAGDGLLGNPANDGSNAAGAAYVYRRVGADWQLDAYLKAFASDPDDEFGTSVAVSGNTVVVGAPQEDGAQVGVGGDFTDDSVLSSGAVYVFGRNVATWSAQAYLKAAVGASHDMLGTTVAIDGDTVLAGAPQDDGAATGIDGSPAGAPGSGASGAAHLFLRQSGVWSVGAYIKASNTGGNDVFGSAVAVHRGTLVVGAPDEDSAAVGMGGNPSDETAPEAGAVYVLR